jgi:hypothetical protein
MADQREAFEKWLAEYLKATKWNRAPRLYEKRLAIAAYAAGASQMLKRAAQFANDAGYEELAVGIFALADPPVAGGAATTLEKEK